MITYGNTSLKQLTGLGLTTTSQRTAKEIKTTIYQPYETLYGLIVDPEDKKALSPEYLNYKYYLLSKKELVQVENDEEVKKKGKSKKEIVSYIANRDTLFIPVPEKPKRPIEISDKIIEEPVVKPVTDLGIQSDEIDYVDPTKVRIFS
jgi:hypothetical protein